MHSAEKTEPGVRGFAGPTLLLMSSGTVALVFQVVWIKQLSLIVGVDVHAVTTGVAAFFCGLALGGLVLGRRADTASRPLRLYAGLEAGIALIGVGTTFALAHAAPLFATLEARVGALAWLPLFALVGAAPFLMGGTLPAVVRSLSLQNGMIGSGGGRMYAANTAGAVLGALACSFLLIPVLGIQGTALAAAGLGLLAAGAALACDRRAPRPIAVGVQARLTPRAGSATAAILVYVVAGGLALGYEVVWSQAAVPFLSTRSFAFSVVLATYLAGLALGSALYSRWADRVRDPWVVFGMLIAAAGLAALLEIALLGRWLPGLQALAEQAVMALTTDRLAGMCARFAVAALYLVFVPTLLLGAAFPAVLRLVVDAGQVGRDIGRVAALNTFGGIAGTVVTGFLLVPRFGITASLALLAVVGALLGLVAVWQSPLRRRGARWGAAALVATAVLTAILTPSDRMASLLAGARGGTLVYYREGRGGTVAVLEQAAGQKRFRRLYIQGVSNSGDTMTSLRYMRLQSLLPLVIHGGEPRSALVIGLGTGITAGALLRYPGLEQRVVAELLPEVREAAATFKGNYGAAEDPGLEIRLRDGRRELLSSPQTYDLITLEPPPPSAAGVVNLYSADFYELARARLQPDGIVAQWLPLPTQNDEDTRSLVRSFLDVFPYASLWTTELHEMMLVGSVVPVVLDVPRIVARYNQPEVAAALREVGITSPAALLATWVTDRAGLDAYASGAQPVTDDKPRIEYADWVRPDELQSVLPKLLALGTDPPLSGADAEFGLAVEREREILYVFYRSALSAMAGDRTGWAQDTRRVRASAGDNAYYSWFWGDDREQDK